MDATLTLQSLKMTTEAEGEDFGEGTLSSGTATILTPKVDADDLIFVTKRTTSGGNGFLYVSAINPGVSFVVTSSNPGDNGTFSWLLVHAGNE